MPQCLETLNKHCNTGGGGGEGCACGCKFGCGWLGGHAGMESVLESIWTSVGHHWIPHEFVVSSITGALRGAIHVVREYSHLDIMHVVRVAISKSCFVWGQGRSTAAAMSWCKVCGSRYVDKEVPLIPHGYCMNDQCKRSSITTHTQQLIRLHMSPFMIIGAIAEIFGVYSRTVQASNLRLLFFRCTNTSMAVPTKVSAIFE